MYKADEELLDEALRDIAETYSSKDDIQVAIQQKFIKKENLSHFSVSNKLVCS